MAQDNRSLRNVALFRSVPESAVAAIEARCIWRTFERGQQIIDHEDTSRDVFFIVSGRVRVLICSAEGTVVSFRDLIPGEVFGELSAIDGRPRSANVEATARSLLAQMSQRDFLDALAAEPQFALALAAHLVTKVRNLTDRVFEFSTLAVRNRIHAELLRLAREAEPAANQVCLSPAPTNAEIASRISTHREAVSREVSRMARMGLVKKEGSSLAVSDIERLERMVREAGE